MTTFVKTLFHSELVKILKKSSGAFPVGILAATDAKARKTLNPYGKIFKLVRVVGFVGASYQAAVEREAERQGADANDFQADVLPWGEWAIINKVIAHNEELYLRTQTSPSQRRNQPAKLLMYLTENGQPIEKEKIKHFLPEVRESAKQQDEAGLQSTIWIRTYKFSSIKKIRINGETYWLKPDGE